MSRAVAIGEEALLEGWALAGVEIVPAGDARSVQEAWESLDPDVVLVVLTPSARTALGRKLDAEAETMWVSLPE
jgi:vacuolar-type H+-ATPase subunit F/Vma7